MLLVLSSSLCLSEKIVYKRQEKIFFHSNVKVSNLMIIILQCLKPNSIHLKLSLSISTLRQCVSDDGRSAIYQQCCLLRRLRRLYCTGDNARYLTLPGLIIRWGYKSRIWFFRISETCGTIAIVRREVICRTSIYSFFLLETRA